MSRPVPDVVDAVLGDRASGLAEIRGFRPDTVTHTQGAYGALFDPAAEGGLPVPLRLAVALRIARLSDQPSLAEHYRVALDLTVPEAEWVALADPTSTASVSDRTAAVAAHVDLLTDRPAAADRASLQALTDVDLGLDDIVTLSQLIGFLSYQLRAVAGLDLIGAAR